MKIIFIASAYILKFLLITIFILKINIVGFCNQKTIKMMIFDF
jgi:hypothetical protein